MKHGEGRERGTLSSLLCESRYDLRGKRLAKLAEVRYEKIKKWNKKAETVHKKSGGTVCNYPVAWHRAIDSLRS